MNTQLNKFNPQSKMSAAQNKDLNHGTVAIEQSRSMTEAQGKLMLAKQFRRDLNEAYINVINTCSRPGFAAQACYAFPRGGQTVTGPSIKLVTEIARIYGNVEYGLRELSNVNGESEMEAYAWDLETNVLTSQKFKVKHERKAYGKTQSLTDQRDIYELTANQGARRLRSAIMKILPTDLVEEALEQCAKTNNGNSTIPLADRIKNMLKAFSVYNVNKKMIESKYSVKIDDISNDMISELMNIYNSIKAGQTKREDWFEVETINKQKMSFKGVDSKVENDKQTDDSLDIKPTDEDGFDPSNI